MDYIIAILMAGLSFLLNRFFLRYLGPVSIISAGPVVEEAAKTLFAYYLGADLIMVHTVFGVIEAGYDWQQKSTSGAVTASFLSIAGHSLFGAGSAGVLILTSSLWLGLAAGIALHLAYNVAVVRLLANKTVNNSGERDKP
ncbi:hypothetical protein SOV_02940 [Sporomusa ovata DSM 2662]|uniref:Uncharacterized protein n=1 Tax=Sporomusa ovata TaxID=2378 RepID=A0A0U1L1X8_9FIRM|nr:hypothetical protein [Sporomusa ovata]EQB27975.1 hypothetical protein SOV_2c08860 [Sporomusa ovata DSM 2662]CQR72914.1 hypothetical protein SpAn4DRAFT_3374 [Sporomusa ovata]